MNFFFFLNKQHRGLLLCYTHRAMNAQGWVPAAQAPLPISLMVSCSGLGRLALQLNPGTFFLLFFIIFLHIFQEAVSAIRVLDVHSMYILLAGTLPLTCLFTMPASCQ